MSLRWKFALSLGSLAAIAAIAASLVGYASTRAQLYDQIDESVRNAAVSTAELENGRIAAEQARLRSEQGLETGVEPPPILDSPGAPVDEGLGGAGEEHEQNETEHGSTAMPFEGAANAAGPPRHHGFPGNNRLLTVQVVDSSGRIISWQRARLPVDSRVKAIAARGVVRGERSAVALSTVTAGGESLRVATAPLLGGGAVQIARSVTDAEETLSNLETRMLFLTITIVALAALIGLFLANRTTRSLERLTDSAEAVAASGSPEADIEVDGKDEIGRLGRSFSRMLVSLAEAREQQQRFIQDAGHELRTPLTSISTNLAVLDRLDRLEPDERKRLLDDLRSETSEMASLVNELVELSDGSADEAWQHVNTLELAERTAARTRRRTGREITVSGPGADIEGQPRSLERALGNLLDNAVKFDASGGPIEVEANTTGFTVADRGPGIKPGEERRIFERFHRSIEARNVPGSGLGLSIVEQIAVRHGGTVTAASRDGGGAEIGFTVASRAPSET